MKSTYAKLLIASFIALAGSACSISEDLRVLAAAHDALVEGDARGFSSLLGEEARKTFDDAAFDRLRSAMKGFDGSRPGESVTFGNYRIVSKSGEAIFTSFDIEADKNGKHLGSASVQCAYTTDNRIIEATHSTNTLMLKNGMIISNGLEQVDRIEALEKAKAAGEPMIAVAPVGCLITRLVF
jgi:hypothetical protein